MAKTLCRVAGGGKPLKGNAETGDVLAGKTFSNKQSNALTGSMPNNGAWSASTSGNGSVTIPAGYHNGSGTVSGATSYFNGVSDGVSWADVRVNTSSASYNSGYAKGVTNGKAGARLVLISQTSFANYETKTINIASGILIWNGDSKKFDCFMKNGNSVSHLIDAYDLDRGNNGNPISLQSATDTTVTFNGRYGTLNAYQIQ